MNDTAGLNDLVPPLLVFRTYPKLSEISPPAPRIYTQSQAITKAIKELSNLQATQQICDALATRNGPNIIPTLKYSPNNPVLVYQEKEDD